MTVVNSSKARLDRSQAVARALTIDSPSQQTWLLQQKKLDLLLLAGCSCLLTLLYHPVAESLYAPQVAAKAAIESFVPATQLKVNWLANMRLTFPWHKSEKTEIEEEEQTRR